MIGQIAAESGMSQGAANLMQAQFCTFILDRMGRIVSCGEPSERIFLEISSRLTGRGIADFIDGLCLGGTSPSYSARYVDHLCAETEWRRFAARDASGQRFFVELKLSPIVAEGERLFLLNLRHPVGETETLRPLAESMA